MKRTSSRALVLFIAFFLLNCQQTEKIEDQDQLEIRFESIPYIVTDYNRIDTLKVGEQLTVNLWLSDTLTLAIKDTLNDRTFNIFPAYLINDSIVENRNKTHIMEYTITANIEDPENEQGNKKHELGFAYPHPLRLGNLIRISKPFLYFLMEEDKNKLQSN